MNVRKRFVLLALAVIVFPGAAAWARIKLTTLPVRERVEVQLDHASVTLVEEERIVPLVRGVNQVDFSWANTRIDPNTIVFRVLPTDAGARDVQVLSVSYPPNENALVWQVAAGQAGPARVRISYVLGGLTKSFTYRATASQDEKHLDLSQYLLVRNLANEAFGPTQMWVGFGEQLHQPVGLNETRQILIGRHRGVPIKKTYTCNVAEFGYLDQPQQKLMVPMHYVIVNDAANQLGQAPLPYGKVRIFQEDGRGTAAFIGEDWGQFTPRDDEMKLYLGVAQDIVVKRTIERSERHRVAGNLYHHEVVVKYEIENFKTEPVVLDVAESVPHVRQEAIGNTGREPHWELGEQTSFAGGPDPEQSRIDRLVFHAELPARGPDGKAEVVTHRLHLIFRNEW
jgi:hypothetical protein